MSGVAGGFRDALPLMPAAGNVWKSWPYGWDRFG